MILQYEVADFFLDAKVFGRLASGLLISRLLCVERGVVELLLFQGGLEVNGFGRVRAIREIMGHHANQDYGVNACAELDR